MAGQYPCRIGYQADLEYNEHLHPDVVYALGRSYVRFQVPAAASHPGAWQTTLTDIPSPQVYLRGGPPPLVPGQPVVSPLMPGRFLGTVPALPWMQLPQEYQGLK